MTERKLGLDIVLLLTRSQVIGAFVEFFSREIKTNKSCVASYAIALGGLAMLLVGGCWNVVAKTSAVAERGMLELSVSGLASLCALQTDFKTAFQF